MLKEIKSKSFKNGNVYLLQTEDNYLIETTDTFLPYYTINAINDQTNELIDNNIGSRKERWMIGVSVMSGCPVHCKFCATSLLKKTRNLTSQEIVEQIEFILKKNPTLNFTDAKEHKINYTRMGEPFLNIDNVKNAIMEIEYKYPKTHHYISTIGIKNSDFSFIYNNITLQISVHSLIEKHRDWLIPYKNKMTLDELGKIRVNSNRKITVNLSLIKEDDFNIDILKQYFDPKYFFIKLSPINKNCVSDSFNIGDGVIKKNNIL